MGEPPVDHAPSVIALRGLTKRFPGRRLDGTGDAPILAVDRVTLEIARGELLGLLGPNGAGKTTLLLMVSTLLGPSGGTAVVGGFDVRRSPGEVRRRIGIVFTGARGLYDRLTARENLHYAGALYGVLRRETLERADGLLRLVGLTDRADDLVGRYSTGMRVRLALARALLHDPPVLLLDEPALGLDPHGARLVRDLIETLSRQGKTIVLATHDMLEADRLSHRVAIMDRGRIVAVDPPARLKDALGKGEGATLEDVFLALTRRSLRADG